MLKIINKQNHKRNKEQLIIKVLVIVITIIVIIYTIHINKYNIYLIK